MEIGRIMSLFFEDFNAWVEPLIGVVLVVGNAGAEDVHQRKALVLDGAFENVHHVLLFAAEGARHIGRASHDGHRNGIDGVLHAAMGR